MRATLAQYTNDIVSLTILVLMAIALIAAQAGAAQHQASEPAASDIEHVLVIDVDFSFRQVGE
jgi:hypothetical protein